ncbi:mycothiol synthase [Kineococcus sp. SYSU DK006]|uniref:mycothiol synthase n=1 Tax=Kineococcus sp. SYSU DK006 TaxID=3383127 RepID=UPI003D7CCAF4
MDTTPAHTPAHAPATTSLTALAEDARERVLQLAQAASAADAATALSEDATLRLRATDGTVTHLLRHDDGGVLVGYAQLVGRAATAPGGRAAAGATPADVEGELLVDPAHRRRGHGRALLRAVDAAAPGSRVLLWSHGDTPGARALAASAGWRRERELLRMERPTAGLADLEVPALPEGVVVDAFRPGADDEAWTALNAAAFAGHPEQGRWSVRDLRLRLAEPWFDPSVFLLARTPGGALAGFCWMKVEAAAAELYVLGAAPAHAGRGLGRALLVRGLRAVAARADVPPTVELYVDGDNAPALRLYERLGFARAAVDVQYASR